MPVVSYAPAECAWTFEASGAPFWGLITAPLVGTTRTPFEPTCLDKCVSPPTQPTTQPQVEHFSRYAVPMDSDGDDEEEGGGQELDEGAMQVEGSGSGEWHGRAGLRPVVFDRPACCCCF